VEHTSLQLELENPLAVAAVKAIHAGDTATLTRLIIENSGLATARCGRGEPKSRTLLHIATDWPGNFPNGAEVVAVLVAYGADVNAQSVGVHTETPLHWAASCDDVMVLDALLDHGADIEANGACIGGGTPLADAVAFGQWKAARRLIHRGALANLWQAAALGLMERLRDNFTNGVSPKHEEITNAFWCACHGGQREAAEYLLGQGAEINWTGHDKLTPLDAANRSEAKGLAEWLINQGAMSHKG
jgi:hypothetical protein